MGLLRDNHYNFKFPSTIKVESSVKEQRATTDDSIRLAEEYREKIERSLIKKLLCKNNIVDFTIALNNYDCLRGPILLVKIKINDQEFSESFNIDPSQLEDTINTLQKWMADKIVMDAIRELCYQHSAGMRQFCYDSEKDKK